MVDGEERHGLPDRLPGDPLPLHPDAVAVVHAPKGVADGLGKGPVLEQVQLQPGEDGFEARFPPVRVRVRRLYGRTVTFGNVYRNLSIIS